MRLKSETKCHTTSILSLQSKITFHNISHICTKKKSFFLGSFIFNIQLHPKVAQQNARHPIIFRLRKTTTSRRTGHFLEGWGGKKKQNSCLHFPSNSLTNFHIRMKIGRLKTPLERRLIFNDDILYTQYRYTVLQYLYRYISESLHVYSNKMKNL